MKGSGREHHRADRRRIVVHPRGDAHRTHAVREHDDVLEREVVLARNVTHECVDILGNNREIGRAAACSGRMSVTTLVPRENRDVVEPEEVDEFLPPARMLVAAMEKQQRFSCRTSRNPRAIKQLRAVEARHLVFGARHLFLPVVLPQAEVPTR